MDDVSCYQRFADRTEGFRGQDQWRKCGTPRVKGKTGILDGASPSNETGIAREDARIFKRL